MFTLSLWKMISKWGTKQDNVKNEWNRLKSLHQPAVCVLSVC